MSVADKQSFESLTATWEPRMRAAFLDAIAAISSSVDIVALQKYIEAGEITRALAAVGVDLADFSVLSLSQTQMFNEGGISFARSIPALRQSGGHALRVLFDVRNVRAETWIRQRSSTLIQGIVDDQRAAIRDYLEQGLQAGKNPRNVALDLIGRVNRATGKREGGVIGLSTNQEQWLRNYEADLASAEPAALRRLLDRGLRDKRFDATVLKAIREGVAISPEIQARMRTAYANRALKWRGDNIAREETIKSLGAAQTEAYQQQIDTGKLDVGLITKFPITAGDERVRHTHREIPSMNPNGRGWNEPYQTPFGPQMHAPYQDQIGCRCHEKIKIDFLGKAVAKARANGG